MTNNNLYTRGFKDEVVRRFDNIHTITIKCPRQDDSIRCFRAVMLSNLVGYMKSDTEFKLVPTIDVFNCFMMSLDFCRENDLLMDNLYSFWGIVQSFKFLKYLNVEFVDDDDVLDAYCTIREKNHDKSLEVIQKIYHVDTLEFILHNMFTQDVIDMLNKTFIFDGIIENDYHKREFMILFKFDDYMAFMEMFTHNNEMSLNNLDTNIIDYLITFPKLITQDKPVIRIITNYGIV